MQAEYTVSKFLYCQGISVVSKAFFLSDVAEFWIRIVTKGRMGPESEKNLRILNTGGCVLCVSTEQQNIFKKLNFFCTRAIL